MKINSKCTLITSTSPKIVTKEFKLSKEGDLKKITTAYVTTGDIKVINFSGLNQFKEILMKLKPNQCLTYGCPISSSLKLVTEKVWQESEREVGTLPRSKNFFHWPEESGVLMLDYDAPKMENCQRKKMKSLHYFVLYFQA